MDETGDQSASAEVEVVEDQAQPSGQSELDQLFDGPAEGDPNAEVVDDSEDVEYEGKQYRVPKEVKDALLRQADYTRKTQEVAEQRRSHEEQAARFQQEQQQFAQTVQMQRANIQAYAGVAALDQRLQEFDQVNWQQLNAENPVEAQRLWFQRQQLQDSRGKLAGQISQYEQQMTLRQQQEIAQRLEQGRQVIAREIKDWSPEKDRALTEFGKKAGYTAQELSQINDPRAVLVLHKAWQYDQMMQKASQKPAAATPAAPLRVVKSGNGSSVNPSEMSMDQWAEYERKRVAKKRS